LRQASTSFFLSTSFEDVRDALEPVGAPSLFAFPSYPQNLKCFVYQTKIASPPRFSVADSTFSPTLVCLHNVEPFPSTYPAFFLLSSRPFDASLRLCFPTASPSEVPQDLSVYPPLLSLSPLNHNIFQFLLPAWSISLAIPAFFPHLYLSILIC